MILFSSFSFSSYQLITKAHLAVGCIDFFFLLVGDDILNVVSIKCMNIDIGCHLLFDCFSLIIQNLVLGSFLFFENYLTCNLLFLDKVPTKPNWKPSFMEKIGQFYIATEPAKQS